MLHQSDSHSRAIRASLSAIIVLVVPADICPKAEHDLVDPSDDTRNLEVTVESMIRVERGLILVPAVEVSWIVQQILRRITSLVDLEAL